MMQNMIRDNPNMQQIMPIVQKILSDGGSNKEKLEKACKIAGLNVNEVEKTLNNNGINL